MSQNHAEYVIAVRTLEHRRSGYFSKQLEFSSDISGLLVVSIRILFQYKLDDLIWKIINVICCE